MIHCGEIVKGRGIMSEYIERYKAMDEINKWLDSVGNVVIGKGLSYYGELMGCLQDVPAADVAEVMHGKWEDKVRKGFGAFSGRCSKCKKYSGLWVVNEPYRFCPYCGAKMGDVEE